MKNSKQKNTNAVYKGGSSGSAGGVTRVKTDGRIGSPTPAGRLKGGLDVNNNSRAQPHSGGLAGSAANHLGTGVKGGTWVARVEKARALAATPRRDKHVKPINAQSGSLKRMKPN